MGERDAPPDGVPCWVEALQQDPQAGLDFYGALFGWDFSEPAVGGAFIARVGGRAVAGIRALSDLGGLPVPPLWSTSTGTDDIDAVTDRAAAAGGRLLLGPRAVPGGRWAVLVDPTGAAFGVRQAAGRSGAELVNEPGTWMMSSLHTPDPGAAGAFYGELFRWHSEPIGAGSPTTLFRLPGYVGGDPGQSIPRDVVAVMTATASDPGAPVVPPHWSVNFRVADAHDVAAEARALGGRVVMPPMDTPGFRSAVLSDPQGAVFSVSQLLSPA